MLPGAEGEAGVDPDDPALHVPGHGFPRGQDQEVRRNTIGMKETPPVPAPVLILEVAESQFEGSEFGKYITQIEKEGFDAHSKLLLIGSAGPVGLKGAVPEVLGDDALASKVEEKCAQGLMGDGMYVDGDLQPSRMLGGRGGHGL
jgi:hypothetical protein